MGLVVGGKKVSVSKDTTAQTGPDTGSAQEGGELKERDFFVGRKLKFGQEMGTNQPTYACKVHTEKF